MTVYAPTGTASINVSQGCGSAHSADHDLGPGEHLAVDCAACEPHILATKTGWSSDVSTVALTPDERAVYEQQEKVGQRAQAIASRALAERLGDLIRMDGAPAAPVDPVQDVISKLSALNDDQLAALRAVFTADQAAGAAETAAKRGPGRPRKSE